jgi:hypothetical protein
VRFVDSCGDGFYAEIGNCSFVVCNMSMVWFVSTPGMGEYGLKVEVIGSERYTLCVGDSFRQNPAIRRSEGT